MRTECLTYVNTGNLKCHDKRVRSLRSLNRPVAYKRSGISLRYDVTGGCPVAVENVLESMEKWKIEHLKLPLIVYRIL